MLSAGTPDERRDGARAALAAVGLASLGDARLILYAPTWRDGEPDPAIPTAVQWRRLIELLEARDAVLLVRSHPLGAGDYEPPFETDRVHPLGSSRLRDATPVLPALTALITDYSSMAFDASLVPLPVLYLAPDVEAYGRRRGFYGRFTDVAGTDAATTWDETIDQLDAVLADPLVRDERIARSIALSQRVHTYRDGENTARVYRAILNGARLSGGVPEHRESTA